MSCPKHSLDEEQELKDTNRQIQLRTAKEEREREFEGISFPIDLPEELLRAGAKRQRKISSCFKWTWLRIYVAYSNLSLVFPVSLVLVRPPEEFIRIYLYGAHKRITFILFVVCVWWGVEYFQMVRLSPEIRLYLRNLRYPCFLDGDYVFTRQKIVNHICKDLVPMEGAWQRSIVTIQDVFVEASHLRLFLPNQGSREFHYT
jgi:hypothetical protein